MDKLIEDQQIKNIKNAKLIIDDVLPNKNFFAFKLFDDNVKQEQEMTEILRINEQAIDHGNYFFINENEAQMLPILMSHH